MAKKAPKRRKIYVYISGPITSSGNLIQNMRAGIDAKTRLIRYGYYPFCPHEGELSNLVHNLSWEENLKYDEGLVEISDAILRLPGPSKGADRECRLAKKLRIPVFHTVLDLRIYFGSKYGYNS